MTIKDNIGEIIGSWWFAYMCPDSQNRSATGIRARIRRADHTGILCEPAVHLLANSLQIAPANTDKVVRFINMVGVLSEVTLSTDQRLAARLGSNQSNDDSFRPLLSPGRFEKIIRAEDTELPTLLRRAIIASGQQCNVAALGNDLMFWGFGNTKNEWCFQYFRNHSAN